MRAEIVKVFLNMPTTQRKADKILRSIKPVTGVVFNKKKTELLNNTHDP